MALYEPSPKEAAAQMNAAQVQRNVAADFTQQFNDLAAKGMLGANVQPLPMPGEAVTPPSPGLPPQPLYTQPVNPSTVGRAVPAQAVTPPAVPQAPQAPPAMQEPGNQPSGLIDGKYGPWTPAAEQGYFNLLNYATTAVDKVKTLEAELASLRSGVSAYPTQYGPATPLVPGSPPGVAPRVNPAERYPASPPVDWAQNGTVRQVASSMGLEDPAPLAQFAQEIAAQSAAAARQAAAAEFEPIRAQQDAEAAMRREHPDAFKYVGEMQVFLQSTPSVAMEFTNLMQKNEPLAAMKYAWAEFRAQAMTYAQQNLQAQAADATAQRNAAMAHAGMSPSQPGTPVQAADPRNQRTDPEVLKELAARNRAGDYQAGQAFTALTVGEMLKNDPLYEQAFGPRR